MRFVVSLYARIIGLIGTKGLVGAVLLISIVLYAGLFILPQPVTFAYAGDTCVPHITLLPGLHRSTQDRNFTQQFEGGFSVGSFKPLATKTCFTPTKPPGKGGIHVGSALFGVRIFEAKYALNVPTAPTVLGSVQTEQIALTKPLKLAMSQPDQTFEYHARVAEKSQQCEMDATNLACKLDELDLKQGGEYAVRLERSFKGETVGSVAEATVRILPAVEVSASTIRRGETVYARPKNMTIVANKQLIRAEARLVQVDGTVESAIPVVVTTEGANAKISWQSELPREKAFRLVLTSALGADGSTITSPHSIDFKTSGGPKVSSVNIGKGGVAPGARVIVTFDQPLAATFIAASIAKISGVDAVVTAKGNQITYTLQRASLCTPFTLTIVRGLPGGNGLVSSSDWSYASRITCRRTVTIGKSVNGRPIVAYYYGSGSQSVLFTGGIHGSEPSGTYLMQDWAKHLDTNAYKIPAGRQVVIVPSINPDGIATNNRYNAHGVNIDRNFPSSDWTTDIDTSEGVKPGGGGPAPLSEPEAQALASLTSSLQLRLMVSYHAKGSLVGINGVGSSRSVGSMYASAVGYQTMFDNAEQIMGYSFTGEYETWIGEKLGAPAVLVELPTYSGRYFSQHQAILWKMVGI